MNFVSRRRTSHADRTLDLHGFDRRPRRADGARAGEEFQYPEGRRHIGFVFAGFANMPRLPAGCRRIVDLATLSGKRQRAATADAAQVRDTRPGGRRRALIACDKREAFARGSAATKQSILSRCYGLLRFRSKTLRGADS